MNRAGIKYNETMDTTGKLYEDFLVSCCGDEDYVCLSVCLSVLSVCLSFCRFERVCRSVSLSVCLPV